MKHTESETTVDWPATGSAIAPKNRTEAATCVRQASIDEVSIGGPGATFGWDLRRLDAVISFQQPDMVITTETGITLAELKDMVEEKGLWLPLDSGSSSAEPLAELLMHGGGISWLSHRHGMPRDWVTGMTVLDDHGNEVVNGAKVVKNVAGYQLTPLYLGSHYLFGPILEITFRLLPLPKNITAVRLTANSPAPLLDFVDQSRTPAGLAGAGEPWEGLLLSKRGSLWELQGFSRMSEKGLTALLSTEAKYESVDLMDAQAPPREQAPGSAGSRLTLQTLPSQVRDILLSPEVNPYSIYCYPAAGIIHLSWEDEHRTSEPLLQRLSGSAARIISRQTPFNAEQIISSAFPAAIAEKVKQALDPRGVFGPLVVGQ